jgi:hypothetical protein
MAAGSLVLANHELFIAPHQPLHFTRGYIWTPLFLLGLPALQRVLAWLARRLRGAVALVTALFLLDNSAWVSIQLLTNVKGAGYQLDLTNDQRAALQRLQEPALADHLLVADDRAFAILAVVYTPLRPWASHIASTPYANQRLAEIEAWVSEGVEVAAWRERPVIFVRESPQRPLDNLPWVAGASAIERYGNLIVVVRPAIAR